MTLRLKALRRRVERSGDGRARRYSRALREAVMAAAAVAREAGWSWTRLGEELGISHETLRRWWYDEARASGPTLVAVDIEDGGETVGGRLSVVTPMGYRVEGLGVDEAAKLLQTLS